MAHLINLLNIHFGEVFYFGGLNLLIFFFNNIKNIKMTIYSIRKNYMSDFS